MKPNTIKKQSVQYRVWSDAQCAEVVHSALRILSRTGCKVQNQRAKDLLKEAGCLVEGERVRIPRGLTEWAINRAPSALTLYDREGKPAMELSPCTVNFGPAITCTQMVDYETGQRRRGTKRDAENVARVIDAMPNIAWASALVSISDACEGKDDIAEIHAVLKNTSKPMMYWAHNIKNLACEFEMFEAVAGSLEKFQAKPFAVNLVCPMDPLVHTDNGMEQVMFMAEKNAPVAYIAGVGFGLSGPITLAGSIAVGLADTLAGLVVSQLTRPGAPFIVSKFNDNIDMKTMTMAHSRPELIIAQCATSDVFRHMGLPFCSNFGNTDSGVLDEISTFDKAIQLYACMLSGANMSFAIGAYEAGNLTRLEDFVLCNEMIEYFKVLVNGIEISDETLAEDVIDEVGPGGDFISEEHTIDHLHDFYKPDIMKPLTFDQWETSKNGLRDRLRGRVAEIVSEGARNPLTSEKCEKLDEIMKKAEKEC